MNETKHWSEDRYWTDALERFHHLEADGQTQLTLNLPAILEVAFNGDGPAYKLMDAMVSVREQEDVDGFRGAPRIMLALLMRLQELSQEPKDIPSKP